MSTALPLSTAILWVILWFVCMLLYTTLDLLAWRKLHSHGSALHVFTILLFTLVYLHFLTHATLFQVRLLENFSLCEFLLAAATAVLFYLLLDHGIDTLLERFFPQSEEHYQQTLQSLRAAPIASAIQVCVLAPIIEEVLMRGFVLGGLSVSYGQTTALLISSLLFALLHFNMVQTLSAFLCGICLGLLYLGTGSILCCIMAHMGYNLISYLSMVLPLRKPSEDGISTSNHPHHKGGITP